VKRSAGGWLALQRKRGEAIRLAGRLVHTIEI